MHENTWGRVTFLVNTWCFTDLTNLMGLYSGGMGGVYTEELIFGMLIGLHIWGAYTPGAYIRGAY